MAEAAKKMAGADIPFGGPMVLNQGFIADAAARRHALPPCPFGRASWKENDGVQSDSDRP
jgi:hypothetical protein